MLQYILLFIVGAIEELTAMTYYLMGRQNHKFLCSMLAGMRILIWVFVTYSIFQNIKNIYPIFIPYMMGAMTGNFISLSFESLLLKYVLKMKKKRGRKQKRWYLWNYRNK
jgi:hypothetical protein